MGSGPMETCEGGEERMLVGTADDRGDRVEIDVKNDEVVLLGRMCV